MSRIVELELEHRDRDQVFSYYHGNEMLHFNATLLARMRLKLPKECFRLVTMDLDEDQYRLCIEHRGIEEPRVRNLRGVDLREPGYACLFEENGGSFTIVDGHHRLVRRWRGGVRTMNFWFSERGIWQHCLVHYPPEYERILAQGMPERVQEPTQLLSRVEVRR